MRGFGPVGVGGNHQLALGINENPLPEYALRGKAAIIITIAAVTVGVIYLHPQ